MTEQLDCCQQSPRPSDPAFLFERVECYYRDRIEASYKGQHPLKGLTPEQGAVKLRSNDYLCIAGDPRVIDAEVRVLRAAGHGDLVSRAFVHHEADALQAFEQRVARLMGAEAAVLANSGYCANVGLIQAICRPVTPVFLDMKAHLSLWEGVKSAGAKPTPFCHNDADHLDRLIGKIGPGVIVIDALYSTDGDFAALEDIVEVAGRRGCVLIVDETHLLRYARSWRRRTCCWHAVSPIACTFEPWACPRPLRAAAAWSCARSAMPSSCATSCYQ